jgi:SAM-dependent methyltransferase
MKKLNLGAGTTVIEGFEPRDGGKGDVLFPLPDEAGSVDEIRASHVLEHFAYGQAQAVLTDWVRALKPGGTLRVAVPDFQFIAEQFVEGGDVNAQGYVMGGQTTSGTFTRRSSIATC